MGAGRPLEAALRAAKPNREIAVSGEEIAENAFVAYFDRIFGRTDPVFLEYKLPAISLPAPLQVRARALESSFRTTGLRAHACQQAREGVTPTCYRRMSCDQR